MMTSSKQKDESALLSMAAELDVDCRRDTG
jgi:hypothetical protein